ncbi:MAG TPA: SDR family oxidoreductase [Flavisolibacter sp.]|jgi:NAD(P)-dependent dehydrogenase (short-subunit alcohol dehydrogenase family)|nr:SDR family oxidoreductase [Flavisolibacter sp.]
MADYFIIGGSSGIGLELSRHLAGEGHRVYATGNTHTLSDSGSLTYHQLNVMDDHWELGFLPEKLDGLVYCPGSISLRPFGRIQPTDYVADFRLNVVGAIRSVQAVQAKLRNGQNPSVLFFSTVAVQLGLPFHSMVAASKGALEGLTRSLAAELAPVIRVNCIAPSLTDTPLAASLVNTEEKKEANAQRHPLKRIGDVSDIANYAGFLLSDKASWVTGQVVSVDGGMSRIKL